VSGSPENPRPEAVIEKPCTGTDDRLAVFAGSIDQTGARCEGCRTADRLTGKAAPEVQRQVISDQPMVLDELRHLSILGLKTAAPLEGNLLIQRAVLSQEQNGM
jgi:hypothetical protein